MKKYILFALILFTLSCTSETTQYISTTPVTKISANYATSGGYGIHVSSLTETGVVWSTHPQPTIRDTKIMSLNQELFEKAKNTGHEFLDIAIKEVVPDAIITKL